MRYKNFHFFLIIQKLKGFGKKSMKSTQKVILVKKIPAKAVTMISDEYLNQRKMDVTEKSVSFSSEDEVLEIAPRKNLNVKSRLGTNGK